jgi:hypothetical protein
MNTTQSTEAIFHDIKVMIWMQRKQDTSLPCVIMHEKSQHKTGTKYLENMTKFKYLAKIIIIMKKS